MLFDCRMKLKELTFKTIFRMVIVIIRRRNDSNVQYFSIFYLFSEYCLIKLVEFHKLEKYLSL